MTIDEPSFIDLAGGYRSLERGDFIARWTGFLFVRGLAAGEESITRILDLLRTSSPQMAFARAKGCFALSVFDKRDRSSCCAVDPFGLMRIFVSSHCLGDDLFALIRRIRADRDAIDRQALASFFRLGFYADRSTLDQRVRVLGGNQIVHCGSDGEIRLSYKTPVGESGTTGFDFDAYIRDVCTAIASEKVSLDLTGGFDSRLIAACLADGAAPLVETVTSGQKGNRDVEIAEKIAARLHLPHRISRHVIAGFEDRAARLMRLTHGQMGVLTYDHMYQIQQERLWRGITLGIGGAGGELWKDFLWLQDLPFLSGSPNFSRLYRRRFEPRAASAAHLAPAFEPFFAAVPVLHMDEMRHGFGALRRTSAYDGVYAHLRLPFIMGPAVSAGIRSGLPHFSLLLDEEGVRASSNKAVGERLFSRWHRAAIARLAPELVRERTTEGLSARSGGAVLADAPYYLGNKIERLAQKVAQRMNLPDVVRLTLDDPETLAYAKKLGAAPDAFRRLRDFGILAEDAEPEALSRIAFDRALTSGLALLEIMP